MSQHGTPRATDRYCTPATRPRWRWAIPTFARRDSALGACTATRHSHSVSRQNRCLLMHGPLSGLRPPLPLSGSIFISHERSRSSAVIHLRPEPGSNP